MAWDSSPNFPFCGIGFEVIFFAIRLEYRRSSLGRRLLQVVWIGGTGFWKRKKEKKERKERKKRKKEKKERKKERRKK